MRRLKISLDERADARMQALEERLGIDDRAILINALALYDTVINSPSMYVAVTKGSDGEIYVDKELHVG